MQRVISSTFISQPRLEIPKVIYYYICGRNAFFSCSPVFVCVFFVCRSCHCCRKKIPRWMRCAGVEQPANERFFTPKQMKNIQQPRLDALWAVVLWVWPWITNDTGAALSMRNHRCPGLKSCFEFERVGEPGNSLKGTRKRSKSASLGLSAVTGVFGLITYRELNLTWLFLNKVVAGFYRVWLFWLIQPSFESDPIELILLARNFKTFNCNHLKNIVVI